MKHSLTIYLFCFLLISLNSCRKDSYFEDRDTTISPPSIFYLISISGVVVKTNQEVIQGAEVFIGDLRAVTDKNGVYLFRNIRVPADVTAMSIKAVGYESQLHLFLPEKGKVFRQDFSLKQKQHTASFNNAQGIILELEKQARLEIPANAIQQFSGAPYNGEVRILAEFLDPDNADHMASSPGIFLTGNGLENKKSILSHGLLHVRMETPSGVKLKLNSNYSAKFKAPVHSALLQQIDPGASVWYLNESNGNWTQGPAIQRNGSFFETTINELSWITYGKSIECAWLSGNFENIYKVAYNQSPLEIKVGEFYRNRITPGADGRFRFLVPRHNPVNLKLKSICNSLIYNKDFGALTSDTTELGIIKVTALPEQLTITGRFNVCAEKNHNAYLLVQTSSGNKIMFPSAQNVFSGVLDNCSSQGAVSFSIVNASVGKSSPGISLPENILQYDLGQFELCDENNLIPSYAYVTIGNKTYFSSIADASFRKIDSLSVHEYELDVSAALNNREMEIQFLIFDLKEGYTLNPKAGFKISGSGARYMTCNLPSPVCNVELIISDYHGPGSLVKGTFSGSDSQSFSFEGGFKIRVVERQ